MRSILQLKVCDIASTDVLTITPDEPMHEAIRLFAANRVSCLVVVDAEKPVGIVTERDLLRLIGTRFNDNEPARAVMSVPLTMVRQDMDFAAAQNLLSNRGIRHLVLVDEAGDLYGVATETDFRRHISDDLFQAIQHLGVVMDKAGELVTPDRPLSDVLERMASRRSDHVVIGRDGQAEGIVTERDLARLLVAHLDSSRVTVGTVMTRPLQTIGLDASVVDAAQRLAETGLRHLVVVDVAGRFVGVVNQHRMLERLNAVMLSQGHERLEREICRSEQRFRDLVENLQLPLCHINGRDELVYVNRQFVENFGYDQADMPNLAAWWLRACPDETDRRWAMDTWNAAVQESRRSGAPIRSVEYRVRCRDGSVRIVEIAGVCADDDVLATFIDVTQCRIQQQLLEFGNSILRLVAAGAPEAEVLDTICREIEVKDPCMRCSILLLDAAAKHLHHGAAPSLPASYLDAIDGGSIGPAAGSCGTAAYRGADVFSGDIAHDPLWADYRDLALRHGLAACWSSPIFSTEGSVLGTFAVYWPTPQPIVTPLARSHVEAATALAGIAVENSRREAQLREAHAYLARAEEIARMGSWRWDKENAAAWFSPQMYRMFGVDADQPAPDMASFLDFVHPEDRGLVAAAHAKMLSGELVSPFVHRRALHIGPLCYLQPTFAIRRNETGEVIGYEGTVSDVTDRVQAENRLRAQLDELRRWQQVMLDREDRVLELKREVNALLARLGEQPRYASAAIREGDA